MDFVRTAKSCTEEISPHELLEKLRHREDMLPLDVREHGEYAQGHIKGVQLVPRGIIEAAADPSYPKHMPELSAARERQVIVHCATGGRSAMAVAVLQMMGFKYVLNLDGGYVKWAVEGMPEVHEAIYRWVARFPWAAQGRSIGTDQAPNTRVARGCCTELPPQRKSQPLRYGA